MIEQHGPDTFEPAGFGRRGGSGGEVKFGFGSSVLIVYMVPL